jgi:hypothetical protein
MPDIIKPKLTKEEKAIVAPVIHFLRKAMQEPILGERINLPKFLLEDLVGNAIQAVKDITNPLSYNREFTSPNPEYLKVIFFSNGSYIVNMDVGWNDGSTIHSFLVEEKGRRIRYSHHLYEGKTRL